MLTDRQIEAGETTAHHSIHEKLHEHNDCIRFAYEWLDAQIKTKNVKKNRVILRT